MAMPSENVPAQLPAAATASARPGNPDQRDIDRRFRAKVFIVMVAGCVALWGALGMLVMHRL